MNKSLILILVLMFALALGAGMVAGKLTARVPVASPKIETATLSDELKLSPEQQKQMQPIWEKMQSISQQCLEDAKKVQSEQDEALAALLTPEQREKWKAINTQGIANIAVIEQRRKQALNDAIERTNVILNESQKPIYQQLIKDRIGPGGGIKNLSQNSERF